MDGVGAILTCILLVMIFGFSSDLSGEILTIVHSLALIAFLFSIYSLTCYKLNVQKWRPLLKGIAFANITYCLLTGFFLSTFWNDLTSFGVTYLAIEIVIVLILASVELRTAKN